jgi:bacteriocin biosynthesis cyclodehydratase domain-containing protein
VRIQLNPGLRLLSRGPATVQIGLDGRHGAVLDGLETADLKVLHDLSNGIDDALITGPLPADPACAEVAARARRIVTTLAGSGTLLSARSGRAALSRVGELRPRLTADATAWSLAHPTAGDGWDLLAARRRRTVRICGSGRTGALLAATLACAGIGRVVVEDTTPTSPTDLIPGGAIPADLGLTRSQAAQHAVDRALGHEMANDQKESRMSSELPLAADLVVLLDRSAADAMHADRLLAADIAHLSVVIRETSILVGPLVRPGASPCLRCLDLHRAERDPRWPLLLAQLLSDRQRRRAPAEETVLAQSAAALTAMQVLGHLDRLTIPVTVGATLEVELPDGLISRRPWPVHPSCGCHCLPDQQGSPDQASRPTRQSRAASSLVEQDETRPARILR